MSPNKLSSPEFFHLQETASSAVIQCEPNGLVVTANPTPDHCQVRAQWEANFSYKPNLTPGNDPNVQY